MNFELEIYILLLYNYIYYNIYISIQEKPEILKSFFSLILLTMFKCHTLNATLKIN